MGTLSTPSPSHPPFPLQTDTIEGTISREAWSLVRDPGPTPTLPPRLSIFSFPPVLLQFSHSHFFHTLFYHSPPFLFPVLFIILPFSLPVIHCPFFYQFLPFFSLSFLSSSPFSRLDDPRGRAAGRGRANLKTNAIEARVFHR